jgi:hypothetical protein
MLLVFNVQEIRLFLALEASKFFQKVVAQINETLRAALQRVISVTRWIAKFGSDHQLHHARSAQTAEDVGGSFEFATRRGLDRVWQINNCCILAA